MSQPAAAKKTRTTNARGRPREFDTSTVLAHASDVFWRHGYHATSIDDLCKATGLLRGSLYGVFGDKHGIMLAALDHYADGSIARLAERLNAPLPAQESLRNALLHYAKTSCSLTQQRSCLITNTALEMQSDDAALRERIASIQRRMATLLAGAVIRGQARKKRSANSCCASFRDCACSAGSSRTRIS
jgi:TetR/AcrR family transcriptional repressor of nem operon